MALMEPGSAYPERVITPELMRAGRGLLNWSQGDLAKVSGLTLNAIKRIEAGLTDPRATQLRLIETAFDKAGVVILEPGDLRGAGRGVRFRE